MNHSKESKLIKDLFNAGIINDEEFKKAELYLSLSTRSFDTYEDAIEWLIQNRAVSRDRQEQVQTKFKSANLTAPKTNVSPAIEPVRPQASVNNVEPPSTPKINHVKATNSSADRQNDKARAQSVPSIDPIYKYNLKKLDELINRQPKLSVVKQKTKDNLKNCPYLFCDLSDLEDWIHSNYKTPADIHHPEEQIDTTTAMQLYSLVQKGLIAPEEYLECYYFLIDNISEGLIELPFKNEDALLDSLIKNNCLDHELTDRNSIRNYNYNWIFIHELIQAKQLKSEHTAVISKLLQAEPNHRFKNSEELSAWLKPRLLPALAKEMKKSPGKKKKKMPLFFILFMIYILYKVIISEVLEDNKPTKPVAAPIPAALQKTVISKPLNCNDQRLFTDLQQRAKSDVNLKSLGELQNFSQQKSHTNDTCSVLATFQQGTAHVTFRRLNEKNGLLTLRLTYTNIQKNQAAGANPTQSNQNTNELPQLPAPIMVDDATNLDDKNDEIMISEFEEQTIVTAAASRNKYEAVVLENLAKLDRAMIAKQPNYSPKLLDIIDDVHLIGNCKQQSHKNVTQCPFLIYYKDVWNNKNTVRNYRLNIKFVSKNDELMLESQTDFIKQLADEMTKDYQKSSLSKAAKAR